MCCLVVLGMRREVYSQQQQIANGQIICSLILLVLTLQTEYSHIAIMTFIVSVQ